MKNLTKRGSNRPRFDLFLKSSKHDNSNLKKKLFNNKAFFNEPNVNCAKLPNFLSIIKCQ
ncbi:hypothetical protein BpHYR1_048118 [Brachionus plicatilis]|uniref:Uncharacterized protein n=1 Tax=Brachionus plicatilis TaxID=10195 RepID=A0A3M7Q8J4_BRAPC|nr:hypothetical protein BpHYR1_048118 [Brachionus plicatilis]